VGVMGLVPRVRPPLDHRLLLGSSRRPRFGLIVPVMAVLVLVVLIGRHRFASPFTYAFGLGTVFLSRLAQV